MSLCRSSCGWVGVVLLSLAGWAQTAPQSGASASSQSSSSSSTSKHPSTTHVRKRAIDDSSALDPGTVSNNVYSNRTFGFTCKIPVGWVLRTDEMNARDDDSASDEKSQPQGKQDSTDSKSRVLLAAFSRPPEARGEDINASIVIAVESASAYPGLKEAVQYLKPVEEVAKGQGLEVDQEPYEYTAGARVVTGEDFVKDVGTRELRQTTLVALERGWVISFTFIGGTEGERADLVEGLNFAAGAKAH